MGLFSHNNAYKLTPSGRMKADNLEGEGIMFSVLRAISESGEVATPKEISQSTHFNEGAVTRTLKVLERSGYVCPAK